MKRALLGATAAIALCGSVNATQNGWYVGLEGGANWVDDIEGTSTFDPIGVPPPVTVPLLSSDIESGWAILGTVGYAFYDSNWRIEGEAGFRRNEFFAGYNVDELSLMVNALYDIPLSSRIDLTLGAGAGFDRMTFPFSGGELDDWSFAYQGIAGLSYELSDRWDLTLTYRYLTVTDLEFTDSFPGGDFTAAFDDVHKHTVTIGLRFDLAPDDVAAPPPPPPPPPPPRENNFVIFFGFGKCNITAEADAVLSEAAASARSGNSTSVSIVGHTDTVGGSKANQRLSECRADAAKSNMVGKGVSAGAISTSGRGEGELMVQTSDNVKEPQNRRANINVN